VPRGVKTRISKKDRVLQFAAERGWTHLGEAEWNEIRDALPDISESIIRESGLKISAPWSGLNTHSLEALNGDLRAFCRVHETRADLRRYCREQVIRAKERARWAAKNPKLEENKRAMKSEMVEWMLVWLDDPAVFPVWAQLRLDIIEGKNAIH